MGLPRWLSNKESACQCSSCRRHRRHRFDTWVRKILWRRKWQPTPLFLPGESLGQRSLVCYSLWGCNELDTTEQLSLSLPSFAICISVFLIFYFITIEFLSISIFVYIYMHLSSYHLPSFIPSLSFPYFLVVPLGLSIYISKLLQSSWLLIFATWNKMWKTFKHISIFTSYNNCIIFDLNAHIHFNNLRLQK